MKLRKNLCVVKRHGHMQNYDERKVYASVYSAAMNCEYGEEKAEKIAGRIAKKITMLIRKSKVCLTSQYIREQVLKMFKDKDVALMYKTHLDLS